MRYDSRDEAWNYEARIPVAMTYSFTDFTAI
jgi:hypothetical protein